MIAGAALVTARENEELGLAADYPLELRPVGHLVGAERHADENPEGRGASVPRGRMVEVITKDDQLTAAIPVRLHLRILIVVQQSAVGRLRFEQRCQQGESL